MAHAGKIISNTAVKFIKTAADTDGELLEMEATYNTTVDAVPEHYHPHQDEHIEVLAGMVSVCIKGQERIYVAGESFDIPCNIPHAFLGAAGCEEAQIRWQIRPALDSETFFETVYGLGADGKMKDTGMPNIFQLAVIARAFKNELHLTKPSRIMQEIVFGLLAPIGRLLGYQARYKKYSNLTNINPAIMSQRKDLKMIHFERTLEIDAMPDDVWAILGNFRQVDEFAPEIVSVDALTDGADGVGSKRRNHFKNGTSLVEEIIEWEPAKRRFRLQMLDMDSMPLHEGCSAMSVEPRANGGSKVVWNMDFRVKYGPLGWILGQTMMKMMMGKIIDGNLQGLANKVGSNRTAIA